MENEIKININNPKELEKLYRDDKTSFVNAFNAVYQDVKEQPAAQIWNERINFTQEDLTWGNKNEIIFIVIAAVISGLIAKMPGFLGIEYDAYLAINISFVVFPMLSMYFAWKQGVAINKYLLPALIFIGSAVFINSLPYNEQSSTFILTTIHLPIFLWMVLGYAFVGGDLKDNQKRISFLKFNGNFIVMTALIFFSGVLFTGITIGLFELLGLDIKQFYFEQIAVWGLSAIPMLSTYLVQNNPQLVNKISPTIARIFTPLVLITLLSFLCALMYKGKNIYNDRNFLLLFNALLIGVMAIILFYLTAVTNNAKSKIHLIMLSCLSLLTIIANGIALSAIAFRLSEFGVSPNRIAVLGANLLMFIHLLFVSFALVKNIKGKAGIREIETEIALFIPAYAVWAAFVTFVMPFIFKFI